MNKLILSILLSFFGAEILLFASADSLSIEDNGVAYLNAKTNANINYFNKRSEEFPEFNDVPKEAPIFPEPMVFDLVRPLGAKKGELEANSLFKAPVQRRNFNLSWAPEVEWAFADGYAFELELPMHNYEIEAYKMAIQGTINHNQAGTFIHGWQWISEYIILDRVMESTLLYLAGYELGDGYSVFGMFGGRNNALTRTNMIRPESQWNMLTNISFNKKISKETVLSIENNYAYHIGLGHDLRVVPQIHTRLTHDVMIQFGVGYEWFLGSGLPISSFRIVKEF